MNLNLNPKIRNAAIAAVLVALVSIGNALVDAYPDQAWSEILATIIPVIVGYLTPQGDWRNTALGGSEKTT